MSSEEKNKIVFSGAEYLNITVTDASHTVVDDKGKVLFEKRK